MGKEHIRRGAWMDIHISTFVGCLESAFDCLAACAIGVLRIPKPLKTAQLSQFNDLNTLKPRTPEMKRAWDDFARHLAFHKSTPPDGWREWLNGMRNLFTHRARLNRTLLQRTRALDEPQLVIVTDTPEDVYSRYRFDLHLRRRPRLSDMEDFILAPSGHDLWLDETAITTLAGVFDAANAFVEDTAHFLLAWWRYAEKWSSSAFPPPLRAWRPTSSLGASFGGAAPPSQPFMPASGLGNPALTERLAVAERLRAAGRLPRAKKT